MIDDLWARSRSGSHAGRGFHYQDAVVTELALRAWRGELPIRRLVPEGLDDVSIEFDTHWLHLQAKSRRTHRGDFTIAELTSTWRHLAERLAADPAARAALVLERPVPGVETGLERVLAEVASGELKAAIAGAVNGLMSPDEFLARTHVVAMAASTTTGVQLLAERLPLAPAACVAHHSILRAEVARLADENGVRDAADAAALTVGDVARLIDDVSEAVDPSALEEAVRAGVCELVDFTTPIVDERFYNGVDVVIGHVVAGLPLERKELTEALAAGLVDQRFALAVGPSGTGKSALIWLAAFETRHLVRWYRIRRLREEDVPAVVRLVKGLEATSGPIGFVVDDVGRDDRVGFDLLVDELRTRPDALVLGACREEDLIIVRTAHQAAQVRPLLEEGLAERIWRELREREETGWPEWREPYEMSQGLLLEYGHLLAAGTRLEGTIRAQVEQRVRERRAVELDVLALVATADTFGAEIEVVRLATALEVDPVEMKAALARLVTEHLIAERDGLLGGLHELRSRHVMRAVHSLPPPTSGESVRRVIGLLDADSIQPFLMRSLLEEAVPDEVAIEAIAARIERDVDPRVLAAVLQALRLVGFSRMTVKWHEIFVDEEASPNDVGVIAHLALHGGDDSIFPAPIQRVVRRLRELDVVDPRGPLLAKIATQVPAVLAASPDIKIAATALAALGEVGQTVPVHVESLARLADGEESLEQLRLLLEAAHAVTPDLAVTLADALGGSTALLTRLERERPWVRDVRLGINDEGRRTVEADYAYVAESAQPGAHDSVVELARYLAAFAPAAEIAVCRAIDATGEIAGFGGVSLADKRIDRRYLPSQAAIAWNRARGRAAVASVAALTETDHVLAAREIVVQCGRLIRSIGDAWVRGRTPTKAIVAAAIAVSEAAHKLKPSPIAIETVGPLDEGDLPDNEATSFVGRMIANNLFVRLFKGENVAPTIPQIVEQVDKLLEPEQWRLLRESPLAEVAALREALVDLHAVVAESAQGGPTALVALRAAGRRGLAAAARAARKRAATRMQVVANQLESKLLDAGFSSRVLRHGGQPDSYRWPSDDFLVLVESATIFHWLRSIETVADLCKPLLSDRIGFYVAPVREGSIVASFAVKVINGVFPTDEVAGWPDLPLPILEEKLVGAVRDGLGGLHEASGIVASVRRDEMHEEEAAAFEAAVARTRGTLQHVEALGAETGDQLILELGATLLELSRRVEEEAASLSRDERVDRSVAASFLAGIRGDADDVFSAEVGAIAACAEWDIDTKGAWSRVQEALEPI